MLFSLQVKGYKSIMNVLKGIAMVVPLPKPTLFTGPGSSLELCEAIAQMGTRKVMIVTDATLVQIGLLKNIEKTLKDNGVEAVIFDGVLPDPTYEQVESGLIFLKQHGSEAILAVGGGSSIDAAKIIAAGATNTKSIRKLKGMLRVWKAPLPFFAIPTTAGTGSEVTVGAVISDSVTHQKELIIDPKLVPMMAALDPSLMTGLPAPISAATGMDALTHAIEAYLSENASKETDAYALAATQLIMQNLDIVIKDGQNLTARQNMAQASYYAGLAITKASLGYVHAISHNLGAAYQTPHGLANAIVLPHVLGYSKDLSAGRLAKLAEVSGLKTGKETDSVLAQKFIDHIRSMLKSFDIPEQLEALKVKDIPAIAEAALKEAHYNYPVPKYMDLTACKNLLQQLVVAN